MPDANRDQNEPLSDLVAVVSAFEGVRQSQASESGLAVRRWVNNSSRELAARQAIRELRVHESNEEAPRRPQYACRGSSRETRVLQYAIARSCKLHRIPDSYFNQRIHFLDPRHVPENEREAYRRSSELIKEVPLGWVLSTSAKDALSLALERQAMRFNSIAPLVDYWRAIDAQDNPG